MVSLDALMQRWVDALSTERESFWTAADVAAYVLKQATGPRERNKLKNTLASAGHCTSIYVGQLARLSGSYGTESRHPDVAMSLYRACLGAAKRTERTPAAVLEEALERGWHVREVLQLGRPEEVAAVSVDVRCDECGAEVRIRIGLSGSAATRRENRRSLVGLPVPCPLCLALAAHEAGEPLGSRLGVLA